MVLLPSTVAGAWAKNHWLWVFFAGTGSLCYLPTQFILNKLSDWQTERKGGSQLRKLTKQEKLILASYLESDCRAIRWNGADPVLLALVDGGILYCPTPRDSVGYQHFNIRDWALAYLKEHPDLIRK
jgi:hypothetical protein